MNFEDIPTEIWDGVYEKWSVAEWNSALWTSCELCNYLYSKFGNMYCSNCPLPYTGYCCDGTIICSKLHISFGDIYDTQSWKQRVGQFLDLIYPYTSKGCIKYIEEITPKYIKSLIYKYGGDAGLSEENIIHMCIYKHSKRTNDPTFDKLPVGVLRKIRDILNMETNARDGLLDTRVITKYTVKDE